MKNAKTNKLTIAHLNINSIKNISKQTELNDFLINNNIDILSLNETNLKINNNLELNQYNTIRLDNPNRKKGGTAIIIKKELKYTQLNTQKNNEVETLAIELNYSGKRILIISMYARPRSVLTFDSINDLMVKYNEIIILGDLNATHSNWYCKNKNKNGEILNQFLKKNALFIANSREPTFKRSTNIIDLCITSKKLINNIDNFHLVDKIDSDHSMIVFNYDTEISSKRTAGAIYSITDWNKYKTTLDDKSIISQYHTINEIEEKAKFLTNKMLEAHHKSKIKVNVKKRPQILPESILANIRLRRSMRREHIKTRNPFLKTEINKIKEKIDDQIAEIKRNSWKDLCEKAKKQIVSTKLIWNKIKTIDNYCTTSSNNHQIELSDTRNPTNKNIADEFAKTLNNTFNINPIDFKANMEALNYKCEKLEKTEFEKISYKEFDKIVKQLKKKSATGPDKIQYNHIKNTPKSFKLLIINLFNQSIEEGNIPNIWKQAKIVMILKPNKPPKEISSYRPISLTSCFAKCLEKFIQTRIIQFLDKNNIISRYQSGFRANHSTKDHIFRLTNDIINNFNMNKYTGAVMFDLEKAFDKVWHQGLLYKLRQIKMPNTLFNWIMDFLNQRSFYVHYNENTSQTQNIKAGVPQGCIISPILFSIYISDISKTMNDSHGLFADDISLWQSDIKVKNLEKLLQLEINKVEKYCQEWCLSINPLKTTYTVFTTAGKRKSYDRIYSLDLQINKKKIKLDPNPKFLGITFDPKLSFATHFKNTEIKIQSRMNILKVLKNKYWASSKDFLISFYKTFIRPLIDYANFPFILANKSTKESLQIKQNKILRMCLNSDILDSTERIHETAKIETLEEREESLSDRYLHKTIIINCNNTIINTIKEQSKIDEEYQKMEDKSRKRKKNCLDNFLLINPTIISQLP